MTPSPTDTDPASVPPPEWSRGDVLGDRFRVVSLLGRGGFGEVYRAEELLPDGSVVRELALKILPASHATAGWAHEMKIVAGLRHPSIVGVVSAGLLADSGRPFVAMELLDGAPLSAVLRERGAVGFRRALEWGRQIAGALDAVHARDVVHLDLKPANLHLGVDGRVRVLDFGIARHGATTSPAPATTTDALSTDALLVRGATQALCGRAPSEARPVLGTPGYTAPEVLMGRAVTPAADAYALGVCLHQLIVGALPHRARALARGASDAEVLAYRAELRDATLAGDLAPLPDEIPSAVRALVASLLSIDPRARPRDLAAALDEVWARPYGIPEVPYLGLAAYGASREGMLFGRDAEIARLADELAARPALVLVGASGSGKSSLAIAGIAPELEKRFPDGLDVWRTVVARPGADLARLVADRGSRDGVVLIVDQLEEAVTQLEETARARFAAELGRLSGHGDDAPQRGLRVICTLREDFATRVAALGALAAVLERAARFVAPPSPSSVADIVTLPARLGGVTIDDVRPVVEDVLRETRAGDGRLPLVSFALARWWETRARGRLSAREWLEGGGVAGALSRHAEATLASLPEDTRAAARRLCLRLVTPERTRARVPEPELTLGGALEARALAHLEAARLVTIDDERRVTLSHESLLFAWRSLAAFLDEEALDRKEASGLSALARAHADAREGAKDDTLLRGGRLAHALELAARRPELTAPFTRFLEDSRRRERKAALARRAGVAAAIIAAMAVVGAGYWTNRRHADDIALREDNLRTLVRDAEAVKRDALAVQAGAASAAASARAASEELRRCRDTARRAEEANRRELATRYPGDSLDQRLVSFLLRWEHVTNLHDGARVGGYYAAEVDWLGGKVTREELARGQASEWIKSPSYRLVLGDAQVVQHADGAHVVRVTREERRAGRESIAVWQVTIQGDKPESFAITRVALEKTVAAERPIGCP